MDRPSSNRAPRPVTGRVADARGRVVSLLDPMPLWVLGRDEPIDRTTLDAIVEDLGVPPRTGRRMLWFGIAVTAAALVIVVVSISVEIARGGQAAVRDLVSSLAIMGPIGASAIVGGCVVPIMVERKKRFARLERLMLSHGCCPHCGFGIAGIPPEPEDEAVVCPECASAWIRPVGPVPGVEPSPRYTKNVGKIVLVTIGLLLTLVAGALAMFMV